MMSNNIVDFGEELQKRKAEADVMATEIKRPLKTGGGGGTFDDMEARVSALEALAKRTDEKLDKIIGKAVGIETDLVRINSRLDLIDAKFETTHIKIDAGMKIVETEISKVESNVASLPNAKDFGHLQGRVDSLPTLPKLAALFVIIGGLISAASYFGSVSKLLH